jgi:hypothetical protein
MTIRLSLDKVLSAHGVSAYRLAKETEGNVARGSIFAMARGDRVKRVDLDNLWHVLNALSNILGREITLEELFEVELDRERHLRLSEAGVPYTGDPETDKVLDEHPDIILRRKRIERDRERSYSLDEAFDLRETQ